MSAFNITPKLLDQLCTVNQYQLRKDELVFVGIRGAITALPNDNAWKSKHSLSLMDVNYTNPRCTLLQWRPKTGELAAFPGSTVPHMRHLREAKQRDGKGANCLMTGFYKDYRKGIHNAGKKSGHEAFRQNAVQPIRRNADDFDFDKDDRIEYGNPFDNIHCGWFAGLNADAYASAGCQVVMGFPKCKTRDANIGPWRVFHKNAYDLPQQGFQYLLFNGTEVFGLSSGEKPKSAKLRYGSQGPLVAALQAALKEKDFYEGIIDGDFGERTMKAVIRFQENNFGRSGADGIVGAITAEALDVALQLAPRLEPGNVMG